MSDNPYVYPETEFTNSTLLFESLGSFWTNVFGDRDLVEKLVAAKSRVERQTYNELVELYDYISRHTSPVFNRRGWIPLTLSESGRMSSTAGSLRYGQPDTHYGDPGINYGSVPFSAENSPEGVQEEVLRHSWIAPETLRSFSLIANSPGQASHTLSQGIDYVFENGEIVFNENPLTDPRFEVDNVLVDGEIADQEVTLWLCDSRHSHRHLYEQWGYVVGLNRDDSLAYKDYVNTLLDAIVEGTRESHIRQAISTLSGIPLVRGEREVVVAVLRSPELVQVITETEVYLLGPLADVQLSPGDVLRRGQAVSQDLKFLQLSNLNLLEEDESLTIASAEGFLNGDYAGAIVWQNKQVPVVTGRDAVGNITVSWELGGWPADVEQFFREANLAGVGRGKTLAEYLDTRRDDDRTGDPVVPATINPFQFFVDNLLGAFASVISVRIGGTGYGGLGFGAAPLLRKIIPPYAAVIIQTTIASPEDRLHVPTRVEETSSLALGKRNQDNVGPARLQETTRLYSLKGKCS